MFYVNEATLERANKWTEEVYINLDFTITTFEDDNIAMIVMEKLFDCSTVHVAEEIAKQVLQFRKWIRHIRMKLPLAKEARAFEYFQYYNEEATDLEYEQWVDCAVDNLKAA